MLAEITDSEQQLLIEILDAASKTTQREIDHTDTREYRRKLLERMNLLERLSEKIKEAQAV
jgi:hypothetical protein